MGICNVPDRTGTVTPLVVDNTYGPQTEAAMVALATNLTPSAGTAPNLALSEKFSGVRGQHTMRVNSAWWHDVQTKTSTRADSCASGAREPSGDVRPSTSTTTTTAPSEESSWMTSPWLWGAVALAAVGAGWYFFGREEEQDEVLMLPEAV
jgi:hypothetical protein